MAELQPSDQAFAPTTSRSSNAQPRRISSMVFAFPGVVASPAHQPSDAHALAMEMAKHRLAEDSGASTPTMYTAATSPEPDQIHTIEKYAFAFDIDGVLIRGGKVLPEAIEAIKLLNGQNEFNLKVPYIFVTNGGGKSEEERCLDLSHQLQMEVSLGQFICGHTPMKEMTQKYKTVLVVGGEGEKCRQIAEGYGFRDVITPGDIIKDNTRTTPLRQLTSVETENSRLRNYGEVDIEAIFVFADSRHWAGDLQIILDLCTSKHGRLGTRSETFDEGPPVYFSHNDVVWATSHDFPRIGMGALRASLEAIFKVTTGKELKTIAFGKPQLGTFEFATRLLQQWRKDNYGLNSPPDTVYFVGDNPESDIRGTNEFDESDNSTNNWYSILVRTGVFREGTKPNYVPKMTVDSVLDAVKHGMQREFTKTINADRVFAPPAEETIPKDSAVVD